MGHPYMEKLRVIPYSGTPFASYDIIVFKTDLKGHLNSEYQFAFDNSKNYDY